MPAASPLPLPIGARPAGGSATRIVLSWLIRLRWFAVVGQVVAIGFALVMLGLRYPHWPLWAVIVITLLTNVGLIGWLRRGVRVPGWLTPGILLLDVLLLTVLLYFTGGTDNPFAILYVVHVAMATVVLGRAGAWAVMATAAACYGLLVWSPYPLVLDGEVLPRWAHPLGQWTAMLLVVGLLAYFIGRVMLALRTREAELAQARERVSLSERLASLTTLSAGAAHELGTPLGTIAVVSKEMELAARQSEQEALAEDAALVRQQVERCRQILERMRGDIVGRSTDEPGRCRAEEAVEAVRQTLRPQRRRRLEVDIAPDLPAVAVPPRALQQALQFLVNNGFDASEAEGTVHLRVTIQSPGPERNDPNHTRPADRRVLFEVSDSGAGMEAETLRRATEPFFTTKEPGQGMGLGLFLVRLVAERNEGKLTLSSTPGKGTTARLTLPADEGGPPAPQGQGRIGTA